MRRFQKGLLGLGCFGILVVSPRSPAQDLPPLPGELETQATQSEGFPPLSQEGASGNAALPPLPDEGAAGAAASAELPPLPQEGAPGDTVLPPLPAGDASAKEPPSITAAPSPQTQPPPSPGETQEKISEDSSTKAAAVSPVEAEGATKTAEKQKPIKRSSKRLWPKYPPNVIFGGFVSPPFASEEGQLAWVSQEVLNALFSAGYQLKEERGDLNPGGFREFVFSPKKGKYPVTVFAQKEGSRVWLRVGPGEPPAGFSVPEVFAMREQNQKVLRFLQKKLGARYRAKGRGWEAPYVRPVENTVLSVKH